DGRSGYESSRPGEDIEFVPTERNSSLRLGSLKGEKDLPPLAAPTGDRSWGDDLTQKLGEVRAEDRSQARADRQARYTRSISQRRSMVRGVSPPNLRIRTDFSSPASEDVRGRNNAPPPRVLGISQKGDNAEGRRPGRGEARKNDPRSVPDRANTSGALTGSGALNTGSGSRSRSQSRGGWGSKVFGSIGRSITRLGSSPKVDTSPKGSGSFRSLRSNDGKGNAVGAGRSG
ncbi:hypothetical protein HDU93_006378, partial [Gonapodya sp. JEL0774]